MKRFFAFLLILVILFAALPSPTPTPAHAETWVAQATSPDKAHALYASADEVSLEDTVHGTTITIELAGIDNIVWMDNKSALMNRGPRQIFIVDLTGAIFYMDCYRNDNPDRACTLVEETY